MARGNRQLPSSPHPKVGERWHGEAVTVRGRFDWVIYWHFLAAILFAPLNKYYPLDWQLGGSPPPPHRHGLTPAPPLPQLR
jgi:hypothetical protein